MYDIVIAGGGTSGCAAAYIAGKLGLKVLLLEKGIHLGGTITSGLVIPVMKSGEHQINTEFYTDFTTELHNLGGQITYQDNRGWFNPELAKIALDNLMQKANTDVHFNSYICDVMYSGRLITHVITNNKILSVYNAQLYNKDKTLFEPIAAKYVIDATGNCEVGKILNCEFLDDFGNYQPMSLRFIMSGIDLTSFAKWLENYDTDRNVTTVEYIDDCIHLSTAYTWDSGKHWALEPLFNDAAAKGILQDTDRNYFQIFTVAGMPDSIAFNCPRIPQNLDPMSVKDISAALKAARQAIYRLSEFCKAYLPGFERAYISNIADMPGVRVSSRIKGKYVYTVKDMAEGKTFENPAVISNYPIDVHSKDKDSSTLAQVQEYQLPIESLMSADYDNLFVTGRCLSADYMAQGALRVQASCFSMGEAAARYVKANLS